MMDSFAVAAPVFSEKDARIGPGTPSHRLPFAVADAEFPARIGAPHVDVRIHAIPGIRTASQHFRRVQTDLRILRIAGDVNKLTHILQWPGAPFRVQPRFRWKGIRSCNFGVSWRDFEAVNGFDETFAGWGHEDADLVLRLHHCGLRRKNGFLATEVWHLWHREQSRAEEGVNRARVTARMESGIIRAERGLAEALHQAETLVTELNR